MTVTRDTFKTNQNKRVVKKNIFWCTSFDYHYISSFLDYSIAYNHPVYITGNRTTVSRL